ncbi:hypothetical protein AAEX28_07335 [Lentisphaerota bacterium WC36G]|nr:hypothetical protein LJT99_10195 [Lentisphaerae bacterium WC36]
MKFKKTSQAAILANMRNLVECKAISLDEFIEACKCLGINYTPQNAKRQVN